MAPGKAPTLKASDLRLIFDFVDTTDEKPGDRSVAVYKHFMSTLKRDQCKLWSLTTVKGEISRIVKESKKEPEHNLRQFWRNGSEALDLQHYLLKDVYTADELAERGYKQEALDNDIKPDEIDNRKQTVRKRVRAPKRMSGDVPDSDYIPNHNAAQHRLPTNSDESGEVSFTESDDDTPCCKRLRRADSVCGEVTTSMEQPSHHEAYEVNMNHREDASGLRNTVRTNTSSRNNTEEDAAVINEPAVDTNAMSPSAAEEGTGLELLVTSTRLPQEKVSTVELTSRDQETTVIPSTNDSTRFLDDLPRLTASEAVHKIYENLAAAIDDFADRRGIKGQRTTIQDKSYSVDATCLIMEVFGMTVAEVGKVLIDIQFSRPLPSTMFLRSLAAAAVMSWAVRADPIDLLGSSEEPWLLVNLREVLQKELGTAQYNRLTFLARQQTLEKHHLRLVEHSAPVLATRLYKVLNEFVESPERTVTSRCEEPRFLGPPQEIILHPVDRIAGMMDVIPPDPVIDTSALPGSTSLENDLVDVFKFALTLRFKWSMSLDGHITCDFPRFRQMYNPTYEYNEECVDTINERTGMPSRVMSALKGRVFVTMMFGVRANVREKWSDQGWCGKNVVLTRPSVYLLD